LGILGGGKKNMTHGAVDSVIGEKAKFKGELTTTGSVSINGEFEGKLISSGEVIIGRGSKIAGDVQGANVIVSGKIEGNIVADQALEITKTGKVNGDLTGGKIIIEEGSSYHGRVRVEVGATKQKKEEIIIEQDISSINKKGANKAQLFQ
jgi:cytoskeletal protein CcmA (bactofilin family)